MTDVFLDFSVNSITRIGCLYTAPLLPPQFTCTHVKITCLDRNKPLFQDCLLYTSVSITTLLYWLEGSLVFEF